MGTFIGLLMIAMGGYVTYKSFKKKVFTANLRPGQTVKERQEEILNMEASEAMKQSAGVIGRGWTKVLGLTFGLILFFIGIIVFFAS